MLLNPLVYQPLVVLYRQLHVILNVRPYEAGARKLVLGGMKFGEEGVSERLLRSEPLRRVEL